MEPDVIREIQNALRIAARFDPQIPLVSVDGIYSPQTADAVAVFQRTQDIPVTGQVDSITYRRLIETLNTYIHAVPLPIPAFPHPVHVIRPNEQSEIVPFVNAMLTALSENYANIPNVGFGDIYGNSAVEAVRALQRMHNLEDNGIVDRTVWNILVNLFATRPSLRTIPWSDAP